MIVRERGRQAHLEDDATGYIRTSGHSLEALKYPLKCSVCSCIAEARQLDSKAGGSPMAVSCWPTPTANPARTNHTGGEDVRCLPYAVVHCGPRAARPIAAWSIHAITGFVCIGRQPLQSAHSPNYR